MAELKFIKMHGLGNDFIVVDNLNGSHGSLDFASFARKLCHRNFGIGADGVLVVSKSEKVDAKMQLINSDGSEAEMCGNGIRCIAKYLIDRGIAGSPVRIETLAGIMTVAKNSDSYTVDMGIPKMAEAATINIGSKAYSATLVDMGNPHCVIFVDDFDFDWQAEGKQIENDKMFPRRTNVEFVKSSGSGRLEVKVWERGAGATLACGTGACAALVAAVETGNPSLFRDWAQSGVPDLGSGKKATVALPGGSLEIELAANGHVFMTGPADYVFEGTVEV